MSKVTQLSNTTYDIGRNLVRTWLPAASVLYLGLDALWDLPAETQVVGTLALIATFLGTVLRLSDKEYVKSGAAYDGQVNLLVRDDGTLTYSLELDEDVESLISKDSIAFKVSPEVALPENLDEIDGP